MSWSYTPGPGGGWLSGPPAKKAGRRFGIVWKGPMDALRAGLRAAPAPPPPPPSRASASSAAARSPLPQQAAIGGGGGGGGGAPPPARGTPRRGAAEFAYASPAPSRLALPLPHPLPPASRQPPLFSPPPVVGGLPVWGWAPSLPPAPGASPAQTPPPYPPLSEKKDPPPPIPPHPRLPLPPPPRRPSRCDRVSFRGGGLWCPMALFFQPAGDGAGRRGPQLRLPRARADGRVRPTAPASHVIPI